MILDLILYSELPMSELGDVEDLALLFGMLYLLLLSWWLLLIVVCGFAVVIRCAHVDIAGMFARAASISSHTTGPAFTIAGAGPVGVLQGFVFEFGV
jgi:hypothetical protein